MIKYLISIFTFLSVSIFSIKAFAAKAASSAMPVHHHIVNNSALFSKSLFFGLSALGGGLAIGLGVIGAGIGMGNAVRGALESGSAITSKRWTAPVEPALVSLRFALKGSRL